MAQSQCTAKNLLM